MVDRWNKNSYFCNLHYLVNSCDINLIMENHQFLNKCKTFLVLLKYIPFVTTLLLTIHIFMVLTGNRLIITELLAGFSVLPAFIIYSVAKVFKFCWVYYSLLIYSVTVGGIITINRYFQIEHLQELGCTFIIIGVFLLLYSLIFKYKWKKQLTQEVNINP